MTLTAERVRELLSYDPDTGLLRWKVKPSSRVRAGDVAGCDNGLGYLVIKIDGRLYLAHRLAWLHTHGRWPAEQLGHIDGDRANNRLPNLREATHAQNGRNQKRPSNNTSGFKGVSWYKRGQRWQAKIKLNGRDIHLGYHDTPEAAHAAYCEASAKYHGEFGRVA